MVSDSKTETIHTAINPKLNFAALKKGGWIAASGAFLLIIGGTLLPLSLLKTWGIPLFAAALFLIAIGWLPYRRLQRLALSPHALQFDGNYYWFVKSGKPVFKIPDISIKHMGYVENGEIYGLAIYLKKPIEEKVTILQERIDLQAFQFQDCDLFLPYFTEKTIKCLLESDRAV